MGQYQYATANRVFKVHVYNTEVRAKINVNDDHDLYSEQWADGQFLLVQATDRDELNDIIVKRYPPADGFVVESAIEVN